MQNRDFWADVICIFKSTHTPNLSSTLHLYAKKICSEFVVSHRNKNLQIKQLLAPPRSFLMQQRTFLTCAEFRHVWISGTAQPETNEAFDVSTTTSDKYLSTTLFNNIIFVCYGTSEDRSGKSCLLLLCPAVRQSDEGPAYIHSSCQRHLRQRHLR